MRMYTYIDPGTFTEADVLVWDRLKREAQSLGRPDELLIVHTGRGTARDVSRLCPVLMQAVGVEGHLTVGATHPLVRELYFDTQLRMGRIAVGDDGTVQVRPRVWSARNCDFRVDMDNVDGEGGSAFGETMKTYRLTEKQLTSLGILATETLLAADPPAPPRSSWECILGEDEL